MNALTAFKEAGVDEKLLNDAMEIMEVDTGSNVEREHFAEVLFDLNILTIGFAFTALFCASQAKPTLRTSFLGASELAPTLVLESLKASLLSDGVGLFSLGKKPRHQPAPKKNLFCTNKLAATEQAIWWQR